MVFDAPVENGHLGIDDEVNAYLGSKVDAAGKDRLVRTWIRAAGTDLEIGSHRFRTEGKHLNAYGMLNDPKGAHVSVHPKTRTAHIKASGERGSERLVTFDTSTPVEGWVTMLERVWPNPTTELRYAWTPDWRQVVVVEPKGLIIDLDRVFAGPMTTGIVSRRRAQRWGTGNPRRSLILYDPASRTCVMSIDAKEGRTAWVFGQGAADGVWKESALFQVVVKPAMEAMAELSRRRGLSIMGMRTRKVTQDQLRRTSANVERLIADFRREHGTLDDSRHADA